MTLAVSPGAEFWSRCLTAACLYRLAGVMAPWALAAAILLLVAGLTLGLSLGPWDQHQLAMLHIPAAWVATLLLLSAGFWAAVALVLERPVGHVLVQTIVPTGGMFAFLSMWSGALWTKAVHGVWWLASAREMAGLALLAVYVAMLVLPVLFASARGADRLVSVLALLGVSQVLLVYFSAEWWNAAAGNAAVFAIVSEMLPAMVFVAVGLWAYATSVACRRLRCLFLERRQRVADSMQ